MPGRTARLAEKGSFSEVDLAERLFAEHHFLSLEIAKDHLIGGLARPQAGRFSSQHQLEIPVVLSVRRDVAGHPQTDAGGGGRAHEGVGEARRPVAILVGPDVEDLACPYAHAAMRDLDLHALRLAVDVRRALLDADPVVARELLREALEQPLDADFGPVGRAAGHAGERVERPRSDVVIGRRRGRHDPAGHRDERARHEHGEET